MRRTTPSAAILETDGLFVQGRVAELSVGLKVRPGEFHIISTTSVDDSAAIGDGLMGLSGRGEVRFLDSNWSSMTANEAGRMRSRIGRIPARGRWLEDRSVLENVLLPQRHHTILSDDVLEEKAARLATAFRLPGIPLQRPQDCLDIDLACAACVRAFLGRPELVILEHPTYGADGTPLEPLLAEAQHVCRRGGGVVWFTRRDRLFPALAGVKRHRLTGHRLIALAPLVTMRTSYPGRH